MKTEVLAEYLRAELENRDIRVSNEEDVDFFNEIYKLFRKVSDAVLDDSIYDTNFSFNYIMSQKYEDFLNQKDYIIEWLTDIKGRNDLRDDLVSMYDLYMNVKGNQETKVMTLVDVYCEYYLQRCIYENKFNEDMVLRCLLFGIDTYTKEDIKTLKYMAIKEAKKIDEEDKLFINENLTPYELEMKMPHIDLDLNNLEDVCNITCPLGYKEQLYNNGLSEYKMKIVALSGMSKSYMKQLLKELYPKAAITLKEIKKDSFISRKFFEDILCYTYNKARGFKIENLNFKCLPTRVWKGIEESINEVLKMFYTEPDDSILGKGLTAEELMAEKEPDFEDIFGDNKTESKEKLDFEDIFGDNETESKEESNDDDDLGSIL